MKLSSYAPPQMASALVCFGLAFSSSAYGQSSASLAGRITDGSGRPVPNAVVRLVSDTTARPGSARTWRYTLIGDRVGKFSQEGIAPGAYLVMLSTDGKFANILQSVSLKEGDTTVIDFVTGSSQQVKVTTSGSTLSMVDKPRTSERTR